MPDVTTTSPTDDVRDLGHVLHAAAARRPSPTTTPCARDRSIERAGRGVAVDEQLHLGGARARHDDPADDAGRRDHRHVAPRRRRCVPLSMVSVRNSGVAPAAMISAAVVFRFDRLAQLEQPLEAARCDRPARAAPAAAICAVGELRLQRLVLRADAAAGRRSRSRRRGTPTTTAEVPRCTSANTPKVTDFEHRHAAASSSPARRSG